MATVTPVVPSASVDGAPIKIAATATPGTLFHTARPTGIDEIFAWLTNTSGADVVVTFELGGATAPDFNVKVTAPANDTILALAGARLQNSKTVRAFAASANVVNMFGSVNQYS